MRYRLGTWGSLALLLLLAACATQPGVEAYDPPGFFSGLWHGLVSPVALIGSLFGDIRIYSFPNSGVGYDCGFMIGVFVIVGGMASAR